MNILELYSGIGGMHFALAESGCSYTVKAAVEINPVSNEIYKCNFPESNLLNKNIQGLTVKYLEKLEIDTILMSPPCQPFTRNGLQKDVEDSRTDSFVHILSVLPNLPGVKRILVENVKGFEESQMRNKMVDTFKECGFTTQEFLLSPNQCGVPNSRLRYYCLAKKSPLEFSFETGPLMDKLPSLEQPEECYTIETILENTILIEDYDISLKDLEKRLKILDICHPESRRSCCFTRAYGRYSEGTGSVFTPLSEEKYKNYINKINNSSQLDLNLVKELNLRLFTPTEISRLMCFPDSFKFPQNTTLRQKYKALGNSINVKVVAHLIKLLE